MRYLPIAVSLTLLLSPVTALAAASSPSELISSIQSSGVSRNFTVTTHSESNGTYTTVWANGVAQGSGMNSEFWTMATIDMARQGRSMRAKVEVMIVGDTLYAKLHSLSGDLGDGFVGGPEAFMANKWVSTTADAGAVQQLFFGIPFDVSAIDASQADTMFSMRASNDTYTLTLMPGSAVKLAMTLRALMNDSGPVSDDFLPWRQLGENTHLTVRVLTDSRGGFASGSFDLRMKNRQSLFTANGTTTKRGTATDMTPPSPVEPLLKDGLPFGGMILGQLWQPMETPTAPRAMMVKPGMMMQPSTTSNEVPLTQQSSSNLESVKMKYNMDTNTLTIEPASTTFAAPANCSTDNAALYVMLQRTGVCPAKKVSTRYSW